MQTSLGLLLKVIGLSTALSLGIKYGLPYMPLPATNTVALVLILLPSLIMAVLLSWRATQTYGNHPNR